MTDADDLPGEWFFGMRFVARIVSVDLITVICPHCGIRTPCHNTAGAGHVCHSCDRYFTVIPIEVKANAD